MILDIYATLMTLGVLGFAAYIDVRITPLKNRVDELESQIEVFLTPPSTTAKPTTRRKAVVKN